MGTRRERVTRELLLALPRFPSELCSLVGQFEPRAIVAVDRACDAAARLANPDATRDEDDQSYLNTVLYVAPRAERQRAGCMIAAYHNCVRVLDLCGNDVGRVGQRRDSVETRHPLHPLEACGTQGLAFGGDRLYVADTYNNRVQVIAFAADKTSGGAWDWAACECRLSITDWRDGADEGDQEREHDDGDDEHDGGRDASTIRKTRKGKNRMYHPRSLSLIGDRLFVVHGRYTSYLTAFDARTGAPLRTVSGCASSDPICGISASEGLGQLFAFSAGGRITTYDADLAALRTLVVTQFEPSPKSRRQRSEPQRLGAMVVWEDNILLVASNEQAAGNDDGAGNANNDEGADNAGSDEGVSGAATQAGHFVLVLDPLDGHLRCASAACSAREPAVLAVVAATEDGAPRCWLADGDRPFECLDFRLN